MSRDPHIAIAILATGTPFYPPARLESGLGGNEATLVGWWRALRERGIPIQVVLGDPLPGTAGPSPADITAGWHTAKTAGPAVDRATVLIAWRNAALLDLAPAGAVRVLYIGDRYTSGLAGAAPACDLAFVGSRAAHDLYRPLLDPRHGYIVHSCGHAVAPDTGAGVVRRPWQCVHSSAPERGLAPLLQLWPRVRERLPQAELVVMGGYRLWGYSPGQAHALARHHVPALDRLPDGVTHLGEVDRATYLRTLAQSQLMLYPTDYDEMCCITALEAAALGTLLVVSDRAALRERTADGSAGVLVPGPASDPATQAAFADATVRLLQDGVRQATLRQATLAHACAHTTAQVIGSLLRRVQACL